MPLDPITGGLIETIEDGGPYRSALVVSPDDDKDLPVIPAAIYILPLFEVVEQPEGPPDRRLIASHGPYAIRMLMQNGETITVQLHSQDEPLQVRPRRIFATGTTCNGIGLLW